MSVISEDLEYQVAELKAALADVQGWLDAAHKKIRDAPHGEGCNSYPEFTALLGLEQIDCTCWKAGK